MDNNFNNQNDDKLKYGREQTGSSAPNNHTDKLRQLDEMYRRGMKQQRGSKRKKFLVATTLAAAAVTAVVVPIVIFKKDENENRYEIIIQSDAQNFESYSITVARGATISHLKLQLNKLEGHKLIGIYKDQECTLLYDDAEKVTKDATIYLKFEKERYSLILPEDNELYTIRYGNTIDVESIEWGSAFSFWINPTAACNPDDIKVYTSDSAIPLTPIDGEYRIDFVDHDMTIIVEANAKMYKIDIPAGVTVTDSEENQVYTGNMVKHGEQLTITYTETIGWKMKEFIITHNSESYSASNKDTITVKGEITIEYIEEPILYRIVLPATTTGYTIEEVTSYTDLSKLTYGAVYSFKLDMADSHDQSTPLVKVNGKELTASEGVYTVSLEQSQEYWNNITIFEITVDNIETNTYNITLPTETTGYSLDINRTSVEHGGMATLTLQLELEYSFSTPKIKLGTEEYTGSVSRKGDILTYEITNITKDIAITVENVEKTAYKITPPESEAYTIENLADRIEYGKTEEFTLTLKGDYTVCTPVVSANDKATITQKGKNGNTYTFEISQASGAIVLKVDTVVTLIVDNLDSDQDYALPVAYGGNIMNAIKLALNGTINIYEQTCGFYTDAELHNPVLSDATITDNITIYTRQATLDMLKFEPIDNGKAYSVSAISTNIEGMVVLPVEHEGQPVTTIADSAFSECENMSGIVIPHGVTTIIGHAFQSTTITSLYIPATVTTISTPAGLWYLNNNLTRFIVSPNNPVYSSRDWDGNNINALIEKQTSTLLITVKDYRAIPDGVKIIESGSLCHYLGNLSMTVEIPDSVVKICQNAFRYETTSASNDNNVIFLGESREWQLSNGNTFTSNPEDRSSTIRGYIDNYTLTCISVTEEYEITMYVNGEQADTITANKGLLASAFEYAQQLGLSSKWGEDGQASFTCYSDADYTQLIDSTTRVQGDTNVYIKLYNLTIKEDGAEDIVLKVQPYVSMWIIAGYYPNVSFGNGDPEIGYDNLFTDETCTTKVSVWSSIDEDTTFYRAEPLSLTYELEEGCSVTITDINSGAVLTQGAKLVRWQGINIVVSYNGAAEYDIAAVTDLVGISHVGGPVYMVEGNVSFKVIGAYSATTTNVDGSTCRIDNLPEYVLPGESYTINVNNSGPGIVQLWINRIYLQQLPNDNYTIVNPIGPVEIRYVEEKVTLTYLDDDRTTTLYTIEEHFKGELFENYQPTKAADAQYSYTFSHWEDESGIMYAGSEPIYENMTFYAVWNKTEIGEQVTVYVDDNEQTITVDADSTIEAAMATLGLNYENTCGFYNDAQLTTPYADDATITEGMTIHTKRATLDKLNFTEVNIPAYYTGTVYAVSAKEATVSGDIIIPREHEGLPVIIVNTGAFKNCTEITSVTLSDSLKAVCDSAFYGCSKLKNINIPNSVGSVSNYTFYGCSSLENITLPEGIIRINTNAFNGCTALTRVTLPDSLMVIESYAFNGCTSLESITLPENVFQIGEDAFRGCISLQTVNISADSDLQTIGARAFRDSALKSINLPSGLKTIGATAFASTKLTSIDIPDSVTSIGDFTFKDCSSLIDVNMASSVQTIGEMAFSGCVSLEKVTFEENSQLSEVWEFAFQNCRSLTEINIANTVTKIYRYAFDGCEALKSVTFADKNGWQVEGSEGGITALLVADLDNTTTAAEYLTNTYCSCTWTKVENPVLFTLNVDGAEKAVWAESGLTLEDLMDALGLNFENTCGFFSNPGLSQHIAVKDSIIDGMAIYTKMATLDILKFEDDIGGLHARPISNEVSGEVVIPYKYEGNIVGAVSGFEGTAIESIVIPTIVDIIYTSAFEGCTSLKSINILPHIIMDYAFKGCISLQSIDLADSEVQAISESAFEGCTSLSVVALPTDSSYTTIEENTFKDCTSLQAVIIGSNVQSIMGNAFAGCTALTSVQFISTEGWSVSTQDGVTELLSDDIASPSTAATYLRETYCGITIAWFKPGALTYFNLTVNDETFTYFVAKNSSLYDVLEGFGYTYYNTCGFYEDADFTTPYSTSVYTKVSQGMQIYTKTITEDKFTYTSNGKIVAASTDITGEVVLPFRVQSSGVGPRVSLNGFANCTGITSFVFPSTASVNMSGAFNGCTALEHIVGYPLGTYQSDFEGCTSLKTIRIRADMSNAFISQSLFEGCISLESVNISSGIIEIRDNAFKGCVALTNVNIPESVTSIGESAFSGCSGVTSINLPNEIEYIGVGAFRGCSSLISINIPAMLKVIREDTFNGCTSLNTITIPAGVLMIKSNAFAGCTGLTAIDFADNVGWSAGETIILSSELEDDNMAATYLTDTYKSQNWERTENALSVKINNYGSDIQTVRVSQGTTISAIMNTYGYTNENTCGFYRDIGLKTPLADTEEITDGMTIYTLSVTTAMADALEFTLNEDNSSYSVLAKETEYDGFMVIPKEYNGLPVTAIAAYGFKDCTGLTNIAIPYGVESIEESAFENTGLVDIIIPPTIRNLGDYAFFESMDLESVKMSGRDLHHITTNTFSGCESLESIDIPAGITSISPDAFRLCTHLNSVKFVYTNGWQVKDSAGNITVLLATDLDNTTTAAEYLTNTYKNCTWTKTENTVSLTLNVDGTAKSVWAESGAKLEEAMEMWGYESERYEYYQDGEYVKPYDSETIVTGDILIYVKEK